MNYLNELKEILKKDELFMDALCTRRLIQKNMAEKWPKMTIVRV